MGDEAKAKKEQERLNKQQEKEREKQVKAEEKQRLKDEKEKMKLLGKDQKDAAAGGKEPKDRIDEEADFEREQALELEMGQYNIREERDTDSRLSAIREETEEKDIIHSTDYRPSESDVQPSLTTQAGEKEKAEKDAKLQEKKQRADEAKAKKEQ